IAWCLTLVVVGYGWLLFRGGHFPNLIHLHRSLLSWSAPPWLGDAPISVFACWLPLVLMHIWQGRRQDLLAPLRAAPWQRALLQGSLLLGVVAFWQRDALPFIYFQFCACQIPATATPSVPSSGSFHLFPSQAA